MIVTSRSVTSRIPLTPVGIPGFATKFLGDSVHYVVGPERVMRRFIRLSGVQYQLCAAALVGSVERHSAYPCHQILARTGLLRRDQDFQTEGLGQIELRY